MTRPTAPRPRGDLRAIRKALGLTQEQAAAKLGVTRWTVWNWENNGPPKYGAGREENIRKLLEE